MISNKSSALSNFFNKIPQKRFIEILILGIISGLPFSILFTAIITSLKEAGVALSLLTIFASSRIFYSLKLFWAPVIDNFKIPLLHKIGRRKSWMIISAVLTACNIFLIGFLDAQNHLGVIFLISCFIGFFSATFDISYDAYRIDSVEQDKQGYAVSCAVFGYRLGALISGAGALALADIFGWRFCFQIMTVLMITFSSIIPFLKEPKFSPKLPASNILKFIEPVREFFSRKSAFIIITAIILYKVGDVLLGFLSVPFYLELGYTKLQISKIVKIYGFAGMTIGTIIGGYAVQKLGNLKALIICGFFSAIVNFAFIWLHYAPVEDLSLLITITIENLGSGAGTSAEVAYLSSLCNRNYSASQYALLSSVATLMNSTISIFSGSLVEAIGWDMFFAITVALAFPAIFLFYILDNRK